MPELPEVETIVRGLDKEITGRRLTLAEVHTPSVVRGDVRRVETLSGRRLDRIERHGKSVFLHFAPRGPEAGETLRVHLGMTGQLVFEPADTPPLKHTHARFRFAGHPRELRFRDMRRFGCLEPVVDGKRPDLGPDAWLTPPDDLFNRLKGRTGRLKTALLDQRLIAGLGNIYVDEALFRCGLHPRGRLDGLSPDKLRALCEAIRVVLCESIELGGTSFRNYVDTEGGRGGFKGRLRVYGKQGQRCVCGGTIERFVCAGRGTHVCPRCQRAPRERPSR